MIFYLLKYIFISIFLVSGIGKFLSFNETLVYFAGITKISIPQLTVLLWILIMSELFISALVWLNGFRSKIFFYLIFILLVSFFIINGVFLLLGVNNCGCFGAGFQSHPVIGIIKTVVLLVILFVLRENLLFQKKSNIGLVKQ